MHPSWTFHSGYCDVELFIMIVFCFTIVIDVVNLLLVRLLLFGLGDLNFKIWDSETSLIECDFPRLQFVMPRFQDLCKICRDPSLFNDHSTTLSQWYVYPRTHITCDMCIPSKMAASDMCIPHPPSLQKLNFLRRPGYSTMSQPVSVPILDRLKL